MILGNDDIRHYLECKEISLTNINESTIRENGIDSKIGSSIAIDIDLNNPVHLPDTDYLGRVIIDTHSKQSIDSRFKVTKIVNSVIIPPKTNILLVTEEEFKLPNDIMGFCCLRSTCARQGFVAPITIIDAGFEGTLTIEAWYGGNNPIKIYKGDRFLHVVFAKINSPVSNPYNGVYKGQKEVRLPKQMD